MVRSNKQEKHTESSEENEKSHEEKKYQFIKEQIRPQGKHKIKRLARRVGFVLGMTVLFCGISVLTFSIMRQYMPVESMGAEIIYVSPSPSNDANVVYNAGTDYTGNDLNSLEDYSRISQEMAGKGEEAQRAVVQLYTDTDDSLADDTEGYCGIMIQKSSQSIYLLTEYALAQRAEKVQVVFNDGSSAEAALQGKDAGVGLAIYRVQLANVSVAMQEQVITMVSESNGTFAVGTPVLAIGKPNGVFHSVHVGVVTNGQILVPITDSELHLCTADISYSKDATGYVMNTRGEMIGVLTTDYTDKTGTTDTAFIAMGSLETSINNMIRGASPARLGVIGSAVNEQEAKRLNLEQGIYVEQVNSPSPAYRSGMRVADVITEISGVKVYTPAQLQEELQKYNSGDEIQVVISRKGAGDGKKQKLKVTLG